MGVHFMTYSHGRHYVCLAKTLSAENENNKNI